MSVSQQALAAGRTRRAARVADFAELTKPRITGLVVMTTWVGYMLGAVAPVAPLHALHALFGTALVCAGVSALNQVWERDRDALMHRTRMRPMPAGRIGVEEALLFGVALSVTGMVELAVFVNLLAAAVAGFSLATYVFVYTPLKKRTWLCTAVGAVPGALPPVIGWAAAHGSLGGGAWALFAILYVWQLPHFYAIAWMYREDYARGGFPMLGVVDATGRRTSLEILSWSAALLPASLLPAFLGLAGPLYVAGALVLGIAFVALAVAMAMRCTAPLARRVFLGSILYLPALLTLLVIDRVAVI
jgi:protoheme IX farnesyltransferase